MRRFEIINIQYVQQYCRGGGAAGEQLAQCVVVVRSSLALAKMLHADAYIVGCTANVCNPSSGLYKYDTVGDGIVQVVTRIGMSCCETRRWDELRMRLNILSCVILRIERY